MTPRKKTKAASEGIAPAVFSQAEKPRGRVGRPTDYDPAYCEKVIEWGADGKSKTWMAATLGIAKQTFYDWEKAHPEFLDATSRAMTLCQKWWEDAGQKGMEASVFNSTIWWKNMAARFRDEWTERQEITGKDGEPLVQPVINVTTTAGSA